MVASPLVFPLAERPRLRPIEVIPWQEHSERLLVLRDPGDAELEMLPLPADAATLLQLLDGQRTIEQVSATLGQRGTPISTDELRHLLEQIDAAGYLEGPRAEHRRRSRQERFRQQALRPAVHAGGSYPDAPNELSRFLADGYLAETGPGSLPGPRSPQVATPYGLIAPHVDLHRGAPTYSWGYKALAEAQPAELYLVLGTCHVGVDGYFALTDKPYDTPLGPVPTDRQFSCNLQRLWGRDLYEGEFAHAAEHSIEFQAVYLRSLGLAGEGAAPMVAIMCDSLHNLVMPPLSPRDVALVADFVEALHEAIRADGRRVTIVAAVDLAHVGPRFGDRWQVDRDRQEWVARGDLEMMKLVADADAEGYYFQVMRDSDARRICGFTPIYLFTELMARERRHGDRPRYTRWVAPDESSCVTFASMLFR